MSSKETKAYPGFVRTFLRLSVLIGTQSLISSLVNTVDTLMIGQLGDLELSAVGLVNQVYFIVTLITSGTISGATIFLAQFYGKQNWKGMRQASALASIVVIGVTALFALIGILFPDVLLRFFSQEDELIQEAARYFRVVAWSYIQAGLSLVMAMILRNVGKPVFPLAVTCIAIMTNVVGNYILIFGHFGVPTMGVVGAAIATVIARCAEFAILAVVLYTRCRQYAPRPADFIYIPRPLIRQYVKIALPVTVSEACWSTGIAFYSVVYYHMGYVYGAAVNIVKVVEQMLTCAFKGTGQAAAIILGNLLGQGREETAVFCSSRMARYNVIAGACVGVLLIAGAGPFLSLYAVSDTVKDIASLMMVYLACIMPVKGYTWMHITSTLRAGGDTKACMIIDNVTVWCFSLPLAFLTGYILNLNIEIVYLCVVLDDVVKAILVHQRVHSRKWIQNLAGT